VSAARGEDGPRDAAIGHGATVLVVAADERFEESLVRLLRSLGWSPVRAESVEAALVASEKFLRSPWPISTPSPSPSSRGPGVLAAPAGDRVFEKPVLASSPPTRRARPCACWVR
jgi:hypothetical protein